jgi:RNA polymerase sigma-70 factor (ECF subfamily)
MADPPSLQTAQLHRWVERLREGDRAAADELLRTAGGRLERLARRMLRGFPNVQRWDDTSDVLQSALMRLLRTLGAVRPESIRDFYNLAAVQIRRELLDLARHFGGPHGLGANHASIPSAGGSLPPAHERVVWDEDPGELERWQQFHEAVERLPVEERAVVELRVYHGWEEAPIAELLQVSERTVRRWWRSASRKLADELGGELPDG